MQTFAKLKSFFLIDLFYDTFCYIDCDDYEIDSLLIEKDIRVHFFKEAMKRSGSDFCVFRLRCRKADSDIIVNEVFPKLEARLGLKYGKAFYTECEIVENAFSTIEAMS